VYHTPQCGGAGGGGGAAAAVMVAAAFRLNTLLLVVRAALSPPSIDQLVEASSPGAITSVGWRKQVRVHLHIGSPVLAPQVVLQGHMHNFRNRGGLSGIRRSGDSAALHIVSPADGGYNAASSQPLWRLR
jgi:hypothetical protein